MRIVNAAFEILDSIEATTILKNIEKYGRVCYKSETTITEDSAKSFVERLIKNGHESVIEHEKITVKFICDRGISHEIVRHRIASYSQESTRYCNYTKDKFGNELTFIKPVFWEDKSPEYNHWLNAMQYAEKCYFEMINLNVSPEQARSILPSSLKTEIIVTMNLREWRHFFKLRTSSKAHPQMQELAIPLLLEFKKTIPVVFDDILLQ